MTEPRRITDQYRLDKLLQSSSSGSVFRATELATGGTVVVELLVGDDAAADFLAAAGALRDLRNPAVPRVLDFGLTSAGSAFLVTELRPGATPDATPPTYEEIRKALSEPPTPAPDPDRTVILPPKEEPPPPSADMSKTMAVAAPASPGRRPSRLLPIGAGVLALVLAAAGTAVFVGKSPPHPPPESPEPVELSTPEPPSSPEPVEEAVATPIPPATPVPSAEKDSGRREALAADQAAARAREARRKAAEALEAEADQAVEAGRFEAALRSLATLRRTWPERAGLDERIRNIQAAQAEDQSLESLLAAAEREKAARPHEGLKLLAGTSPGPRFADRFRQAKAGLEAELARRDQGPPAVSILGAPPQVEKGKSLRLILRIDDDYEVTAAELWLRPEGGRYEKIPLRALSATDYEAQVSPDLHRNNPVELYAIATDRSGHQGRLASPEAPLKIKRKGLFKRLLGRDDG